MKFLAGILAAGGIAYLCLALFRLVAYRPSGLAGSKNLPAITLMIPACGAQPRLEECLDRLCDQDYPDFQIVFGLHSPNDAARPVIEKVIAAHPGLDATLVIDARRIGANPKNCNLANMLPTAKHGILAMVDSDVLVERDFLRRIAASFDAPDVGGVTCLYTAVPEPDFASRLCALYLNDWLVPSILVDVARREMDVCYGAAIAVTRKALDAIGGFEPMADAVAQDYVFGYELRHHGFRIRLASATVATVAAEDGLVRMFRHELRWNRAVRAVRPLDHALSVFMSTLFPAGLLMLASWPWPLAAGVMFLHLSLRVALHYLLRRRFRLPKAQPFWLPLREILNFFLWATALSGRSVRWGNRVLETGKGLSMRNLSTQSDRTGSPDRR